MAKNVSVAFQKRPRNAKLLQSGEWRLATVDDVNNNLELIKKDEVLDSWDIVRLLDGCLDGPGHGYNRRQEYIPNMEWMLLIKTQKARPEDGSFDPEMYSGVKLSAEGREAVEKYSGVKLSAEGREAALLLSCEDKITEVIVFVLNNMQLEREHDLQPLMKSLKKKFHSDRTVLHYAANQPHYGKHAEDIARMIVDKFQNGKELVKAADEYGRTALHFAALHGHIALCEFLIRKCNCNAAEGDQNGETLLHFAVNGKTKPFQSLCGLDEVKRIIGLQDGKGKTALHKAAAKGSLTMIDTLHSKDSNVCKADSFGQTALLEAASAGHVEAVKRLLSHGSSPLAERNSDGRTALHYVVQWSDEKKAKEMVKQLLTEYSSSEQKSLLLWASATGGGIAEASARSLKVRKYLEKKRKHFAEDSTAALRIAIKLGNEHIAWDLLNRGADIVKVAEDHWRDTKMAPLVERLSERIKQMPERGRDQPTIHDSLGRRCFAEGLAALFLNPYVKSPVTVGISGDWGMGKSSLMVQTEFILLKAASQLAFPNLLPTEEFLESTEFELSDRRKYETIKRAVKDLVPSKERNDKALVYFLDNYQEDWHRVYKALAVMDRTEMFCMKPKTSDSSSNKNPLENIPTILTVRYNAWHYQNQVEAWAGLAVEITKAMEETMSRAQRVRCRCSYAWKENHKQIWLELFLPCLLTLFLSGWVAWGVWILISRAKHKELADLKYGSIPVSVVIVVWTVVKQLLSVLRPISAQIRGYFRSPDHSGNLGYQNKVISDIEFLQKQIGEKPTRFWRLFDLYPDTVEGTSIPKSPAPGKENIRIIVFVDDLDRCEDTVILQILSAINLVLAACQINVVLGIDKKMIARAIANKFPDKDNKIIEDPVHLAEKYISKIVQLPLALPDADKDETKNFLSQHVGAPFEGCSDDDGNLKPDVSDQGRSPGSAGAKGESSHLHTVSNAPEQGPRKGSAGGTESSTDNSRDHLCLDVAHISQHVAEGLIPDFFSIISQIFGCGHVPEPELKLRSRALNIQMMIPNYSITEQKAIRRLQKWATDDQKHPREWKRFLIYHRLAWNILSQIEQVRNCPGWQVQLLVWIFCCWQWQKQIDEIIQNWKKLVLKNVVSMNYDLDPDDVDEDGCRPVLNEPSLRNIVERYLEEEGKEEGKKDEEHWMVLKEMLKKYDVSMQCILSFQKFRLFCDVRNLPSPQEMAEPRTKTSPKGRDKKKQPRGG